MQVHRCLDGTWRHLGRRVDRPPTAGFLCVVSVHRRKRRTFATGVLLGPARARCIHQASGPRRSCSAGCAALCVPQVEARNMELNALASRRADPFHHKLGLADYFLAGVTRLTGTRSTPNTGNTVLRKSTIGELALDQGTKGVLVHEGTSRMGFEGARFTGVLAQPRQPRRPGCRQPDCMAAVPVMPIGRWSYPSGPTMTSATIPRPLFTSVPPPRVREERRQAVSRVIESHPFVNSC
jgi:hypothetical protein